MVELQDDPEDVVRQIDDAVRRSAVHEWGTKHVVEVPLIKGRTPSAKGFFLTEFRAVAAPVSVCVLVWIDPVTETQLLTSTV